MAASLVYEFESEPGRRGLEALRFSSYLPGDVTDWYHRITDAYTSLPQVFTKYFLSQAPNNALVALSRLVQVQHADAMRIGISEMNGMKNDGVVLVSKELAQAQLTQIGDVQHVFLDGNTVDGYVIPLTTTLGTVDIVVSGGFSRLSWRMNANPEFRSKFEAMDQLNYLPTDDGLPTPPENQRDLRSHYLTSADLAAATSAHGIDSKEVAEGIRAIMDLDLTFDVLMIDNFAMGRSHFLEKNFGGFSLEARDQGIAILFLLGNEYGLRPLHVMAFQKYATFSQDEQFAWGVSRLAARLNTLNFGGEFS